MQLNFVLVLKQGLSGINFHIQPYTYNNTNAYQFTQDIVHEIDVVSVYSFSLVSMFNTPTMNECPLHFVVLVLLWEWLGSTVGIIHCRES